MFKTKSFSDQRQPTKQLRRSTTMPTKQLRRSTTIPTFRRSTTMPGIPKKSSLFGATVPKPPPLPPKGSLFGATVPKPPPLPPKGSLFGATVPKPPPLPPKGSLFGAKVPKPPPLPPKGSLMGSSKRPSTAVPMTNNKKPAAGALNAQLLNELRKRTANTRARFNRNAKESEGGTGVVSGVQKVEKNQMKIAAGNAKSRMMNELKQKLALRTTAIDSQVLKKLAPGLKPIPYIHGASTRYNRTKEILVNAKGRPYVVFIPAQVREEDKVILSNDLLRPSTLDMIFLKSKDTKAVFGDGYYNARFFGLKHSSPGPLGPLGPLGPVVVPNKRCQQLLQKLAQVNARLNKLNCK